MRTYIVTTFENNIVKFVAVEANNKNAAYVKVNKAYPNRRVSKSNVLISACNIDYCGSEILR